MTSDAAPVLLVLPVSYAYCFAPDTYNVAWQVRQALRAADRLSPCAGVDVFLYGDPADGGHTEDGLVVCTHVTPESLREWIAEWATLSNTGLAFLGDGRPATRVERTFEIGNFSSRSHLEALRRVVAALPGRTEPPLVLLRMETSLDRKETVLAIRDAGERAAFWHLFGLEDALGTSFWSQEGLYRGRVLPQLRVSTGTGWSHRAVARRFSRWRKRTPG
ncbi:hypothetical protein ACFQ7A_20780 [Streptomyces sp. NPDC056528]|uniref:hypothetical protein n=1 Tax=Streptomyces sp. NPDC056528 TaxID=3345854 RepID=UPI003697EE17